MPRRFPGSAVSPHRLARLGHHPFTVRTGVRIPVGTPSSLFDSKSYGLAGQQKSQQANGLICEGCLPCRSTWAKAGHDVALAKSDLFSAADADLVPNRQRRSSDFLLKSDQGDELVREARNEAEALIARLPTQMREKYPDPESFAALFVTETLAERISAAQIASQAMDGAQHATVILRSPAGGQEKIQMQLSPEGWQMIISPEMMQKIQAPLK